METMSKRTAKNIKISNQRDIALQLGNEEHHERILKISKALSVPARLEILDLLKNTPRSLQEISVLLDIPLSSVALHIKHLEEAGLVVTELQPGIHGSMRVCICCFYTIFFSLFDPDVKVIDKNVSAQMPIGNYFDCRVFPTCGIANENGSIGPYDSPNIFYSPLRMTAQLIWFTKGYLEYRFPNILNKKLHIEEISFSMEICSEAPGFSEVHPSDITIFINDVEITTYTAPGDFGARRGKLTPAVWANGSTQYGLLKTFSVRENGCYIDGSLCNDKITLSDLALEDKDYIALKIAVKEDAKHIGGINIFGEKFGDYKQGIVMNLLYL